MNTVSLLLTGQTIAPTHLVSPIILHKQGLDMASLTTTITRTPTDLHALQNQSRRPYSDRNRTPTMSNSRSSSRSSTTSSRSSATIRPTSSHKRSSSKDSSGWYNAEENMTLEDFAERLNTLEKKMERFVSVCATNIVMALMRPTPMVLFVFNPVCLMVIALFVVLWFLVRGVAVGAAS